MASVHEVTTSSVAPLRLVDFVREEDGPRWQVVNDTVMGGRSRSQYLIQDGLLRFSGLLNTNGGGFASLRSSPLPLQLSEFALVRLRVLGDGRVYRFRMFVDGDRASYQS